MASLHRSRKLHYPKPSHEFLSKVGQRTRRKTPIPGTISVNSSLAGLKNAPADSKGRDESEKCGDTCETVQALRDTYLRLRDSELLDSNAKVFLFFCCIIVPALLCLLLLFIKGVECRFGALYYSLGAFGAYAIIVAVAYIMR
jgi:hypothetical protein